MIILLGFKNYDEYDTEYQLTGDEVIRLAALIGHKTAVKPAYANVTFFYEDLTDEICKENLHWAEQELRRGKTEQLELP